MLRPSGKQLWKAGADSPASAQRGSHLHGHPACAAEALLVLKRRLSVGRLMSHTREPEPAGALSEGDPQAASLRPLSRAGISQEGLFPRQALSSWVSVWYSVLHQVRSLIQVLGFTPGHPAVYFVPHYYVRCPVSGTMSAFMSGAPRFASRTPVSCQVPASCQVPSNTLRVMVLHTVPGFASGAQVYSGIQVLRQVPGFYVWPPGLHQAPSFTSDAQECQISSFYVRHPVLHQALRFMLGAQMYVRRPVSTSDAWF